LVTLAFLALSSSADTLPTPVNSANVYWLGSSLEDVTVPETGPFTFEVPFGYDSSAVGMRLFIKGGTIASVTYRQFYWTEGLTYTLASTPPFIDLSPGDVITFTYSVAPELKVAVR
jgi:hypothetical protein